LRENEELEQEELLGTMINERVDID